MIDKYFQKVLNGGQLSFSEAVELGTHAHGAELYQAADELRRAYHRSHIDLCSIVNAKSGKCTENCKFCAQSGHHNLDVAHYEVVAADHALRLAKENEKHGVERFSLVTAGKTVAERHLEEFRKIYARLQQETELSFCASMGFLTREKAEQLKQMGVTRYHCNLETCRSYFPQVCTTHTWDEKVATIQIARKAGMEICSGGIIGMGESFSQRLELAFELRELDILSIPLNILTPIEGTPFAHLKPLGVGEVLTCVALFRFINPKAIIRIAGGRSLLGEEQAELFRSGANGSIVGDYLTTVGQNLVEDMAMFRDLGFDI